MPRHGSADSTGEVDIVDPEPRSSGMAQWSIRSKLLLLAMIPLIALLAGGTLVVISMGLDYVQARQARQYADTVIPAVGYTAAMNAELNGGNLTGTQLGAARQRTDQQAQLLGERLDGISTSTPRIGAAVGQVRSALANLSSTRQRYDGLAQSNSLVASNSLEPNINTFNDALGTLVDALTSELSTVTPDRDTADAANLISDLNQTVISANGEQRLIRITLIAPTGGIADRAQDLAALKVPQDLGLKAAGEDVTGTQKTALGQILADDSSLAGWRTQAGQAATAAGPAQAATWNAFATERAQSIAGLTGEVASSVSADSRDTERGTLLRAAGVTVAGILVMLVVTTLLATIARSVTTPLRRLRAGAVEIASVQLPAAVARIEQDGVAADISLPPVLPADSPAGPETFEVARAVDDLGAEAVRLATAQVRLRRALDEAFVSMSRRSQSMVEKQLSIIDELESQEQDPDQLRNLFRLDHLAARMRRYNDNLLVLAGSAVRTRATAPVKVAELFRAATSEMEQYERVRLQPVSGASVAGTVTGELVHLLAELLDNAAMYSPPSSSIGLSAAFTADGGLQIEVVDAGVGISPGEIDRLNARLTQPEAIDTQVPSRMGLFVVARLARRGGFGVLLQARPDAAGTLALVRVAPQLVIGAPGTTGEAPAMPTGINLRPSSTPGSGVPAGVGARGSFTETERPTAVQARAAVARAAGSGATTQTSQNAQSAAAAAAAAAGVTTATESGGALPRRRRGGSVAPDGRPVDVTDPGEQGVGGLFTPTVPAPEAEPDEKLAPRRAAAEAPPTGAISRSEVAPAETSPSGIPLLLPPSKDAVPPAAAEIAALAAAQAETNGRQRGAAPDAPGAPAEKGEQGEQASETLLPQRPLPQRPLPQRPLPQRQQPEGSQPSDLPQRDLPQRDLPQRDLPRRDLPQRDLPRHDLPRRDLPGGAPERVRPADPLTSPTGAFRSLANPALPDPATPGSGAAPAAWDDHLPTELAARAAAASAYRPPEPSEPSGPSDSSELTGELIGDKPGPGDNDPTPIFDQISVWFTAEPTGGITIGQEQLTESGGRVIDLREQAPRQPSSRWASLGDQRWLATSAQAAAAPRSEGTTEQGLPKRRPGANLLPSAGTAAPPSGPPAASRRPAPGEAAAASAPQPDAPAAAGTDASPSAEADQVRGRLGSYQRGLADARRARNTPAPEPAYDPVGASLFAASGDAGDDSESRPTDQGGAH